LRPFHDITASRTNSQGYDIARGHRSGTVVSRRRGSVSGSNVPLFDCHDAPGDYTGPRRPCTRTASERAMTLPPLAPNCRDQRCVAKQLQIRLQERLAVFCLPRRSNRSLRASWGFLAPLLTPWLGTARGFGRLALSPRHSPLLGRARSPATLRDGLDRARPEKGYDLRVG
jgi:hypothetical protein